MEFKAKIRAIKQEAKGTKTFVFDKPPNLKYKSGQSFHFTVDLKYPDDRGVTRHFTLSSSPTEENIQFTTRIRPQSGFKKTLDEMSVGDEIKVHGLGGEFVLDSDTTSIPQVFVAGGIGITPFRSIFKYIVDKNLKVPVHLIYSNSIPEEIAFKEDLDKMASRHTNMQITYTVTKPEESKQKWSGHTSRVDKTLISQIASKYQNPVFWLCGPPAFVSAMEDVLEEMKIPEERIKIDKFSGY
ncbi:hypothetical protein CMO96_02740 [Candidatus Woesebacteria bacterium]|nr:hypothetical protein [Candidatus Woesebacteria bacterium]